MLDQSHYTGSRRRNMICLRNRSKTNRCRRSFFPVLHRHWWDRSQRMSHARIWLIFLGNRDICLVGYGNQNSQPRHQSTGNWGKQLGELPNYFLSRHSNYLPLTPFLLRDIKNDETRFCLILPIDFFIKHDAETHGSITQEDTWRSGTEDEIDGSNSITSASPPKKYFSSPPRNKSKRTEIIYHFRAMLDGNEKFIWLQAASELGRLCSETVKTSVPKWVVFSLFPCFFCYYHLMFICFVRPSKQEAFCSPSWDWTSEKYFDSSTICGVGATYWWQNESVRIAIRCPWRWACG